MPTKQPSDVELYLKRETNPIRKALESASRYFDGNDSLAVNTLEAVYAQESSFGKQLGMRGSANAAGHFQLKANTAKQYGLHISKKNDQRFDIDYASSAAARYLKDLDTFFSKTTTLIKGSTTVAVNDPLERKKFVLGAFNAGQRRLASAQHLAEKAGENPRLWSDVEKYLTDETRHYIPKVLSYEDEFAVKSPLNKTVKQKATRGRKYRCTEGHWRTIDGRSVFICD